MRKTINLIPGIIGIAFCLCFAGSQLGSIGSPTFVSTFESIGITCPFTGDDNFNSVCNVEYRVEGSTAWKKGHPLFTCRKKRQHRGSIVHLKSGTTYEIKLTATDKDGGTATKTIVAKTWSETFPEGQKTVITKQTTGLTINTSGTASAYRVYEGPENGMGVIDCQKKGKDGITINASYVIIRRLKIVRPADNGIRIMPTCHDVVIEDCEISDFGPSTAPGSFSYAHASGVICYDGRHRAKRIVVQNCRIYNPSGRANSWKEKGTIGNGYHPAGPQGITLWATGGNNVFRYNHIYSTKGECYNDIISTEGRHSWSNTDIYGNILGYCFDDALEMESLNENLRVWGNVVHHVFQGIATRILGQNTDKDPMLGPLYVWRNVFYNFKQYGTKQGNVLKMGGDAGYYFYNNTIMKALDSDMIARVVTNTHWTDNFVVKNNIMLATYPILSWLKRNYHTGARTTGNFLDYNMYEQPRSGVLLLPAWDKNGVFGTTAKYAKIGEYGYALAAGSKGVDAGTVIPNFCETFAGKAPDIGACEKGVFEMKAGPRGNVVPTPGDTADTVGICNPGAAVSRFSGFDTSPTFRVFNIHGQLVKTFQAPHPDLSWNLGTGIYFVQMHGANRRISMRTIRLQ